MDQQISRVDAGFGEGLAGMDAKAKGIGVGRDDDLAIGDGVDDQEMGGGCLLIVD